MFEKADDLVNELNIELKHWLNKLDFPVIKTVFIGGGTPSLLPITALEKLLGYINSQGDEIEEWTIESNPESISKEFLEICNTYGVNRLSVGIQSFHNVILDKIGRQARESDITRALELIRQYWKHDLNVDLISSLPGQTLSDITEDLNHALEFEPDHISFYGLTIEEGTELEDQISKGLVEELDELTSEAIWLKGNELLKKRGYINYEISNFTKNRPCLHNINYWELKPYLGIGPSAVSTLKVDNKIIRKTNPPSLKKYLEGENQSWGEELEDIDNRDFLSDYIMMGLRLKHGIDLERFNNIFHKDLRAISNVVGDFISSEVLVVQNNRLMFSEKYFPLMNIYLPDILDSLNSLTINNVNWFY